MSHNFESTLAAASNNVLAEIHNRYESEGDDRSLVKLAPNQISDLSKRLLAFPDDDVAMLLLHYAFGFDYDSIAVLLKQDTVKGRIRYIEQLLSGGMGLLESQGIDSDSLRAVCRVALDNYVSGENMGTAHEHIKAARRTKSDRKPFRVIFSVLQKVAVVFITVSISFGIALGVNAEFREKVYQWFIETFPHFSAFTLGTETTEADLSFDNLCLYRPTYIPEGYREKSIDAVFPSIYYDYTDDEGTLLTIVGNLPNQSSISLNTEDESVEKTIFQGQDAYYWEKDGVSFFVFVLDGYHFDVFGQFSIDEIVRVAENIKIK